MKVLFVCTGNSARSQMAEAFARQYGQGRVEASSAGIDPKGLHPLTIKVMAEKGIDMSHQQSKALTDEMLSKADYVITVCGHADQHCPALPEHVRKVHWALEDPAAAQGSEAEILATFREIRDQIEARVQDLVRGG
ncbi:MAG: arsenate reductase ArsC [candidate division NC10 bacterium]|jgi:arsenate reductase